MPVVISDSQSVQLERFQRDLLGQHDVTGGESDPSGAKHHRRVTRPLAASSYDVHHRSAEDPVARGGVRAHHFETLGVVVLLGLVGRKPLAQKSLTSLFAPKMRSTMLFPILTRAQPGCKTLRWRDGVMRPNIIRPAGRGMNSVSSAAGSNFPTTLLCPGPVRSAAVKPAPVSALKRASASAAAAASAGSNWCLCIPGLIHYDLRCHPVLLAQFPYYSSLIIIITERPFVPGRPVDTRSKCSPGLVDGTKEAPPERGARPAAPSGMADPSG